MSLSAEEKELRIRLAGDFEAYARVCLRIRTKGGAIEPLALNRSQRYIHERLEAQIKARGRVRALILKGRQVGISTYVGARFYWKVTHRFGFRAFILAHLDASSAALFDMAHRFHEQCPAPFRPNTGRANVKELSFSDLGGGYKVATAGSADIGRGDTLQLFHGSEVGFWQNAQKLSAGIQQAIADVAGTEDIRESTANGIGNAFHAQWVAAVRGDSDFEPIFVPWHWCEEYTTPPPPDWKTPQAWSEYGAMYGLSVPQVYWAWRKNRELAVTAGGTPEEPCGCSLRNIRRMPRRPSKPRCRHRSFRRPPSSRRERPLSRAMARLCSGSIPRAAARTRRGSSIVRDAARARMSVGA